MWSAVDMNYSKTINQNLIEKWEISFQVIRHYLMSREDSEEYHEDIPLIIPCI
jgi:hypothetical protein